MKLLIALLIALLLAGCSYTTIVRNPETGLLEARHLVAFMKGEGINIKVDKKASDQYKATYGAASRGPTDMQSLERIVEMGVTGRAPRDNPEPTPPPPE